MTHKKRQNYKQTDVHPFFWGELINERENFRATKQSCMMIL